MTKYLNMSTEPQWWTPKLLLLAERALAASTNPPDDDGRLYIFVACLCALNATSPNGRATALATCCLHHCARSACSPRTYSPTPCTSCACTSSACPPPCLQNRRGRHVLLHQLLHPPLPLLRSPTNVVLLRPNRNRRLTNSPMLNPCHSLHTHRASQRVHRTICLNSRQWRLTYPLRCGSSRRFLRLWRQVRCVLRPFPAVQSCQ
jgi:hypothetical protein